MELNHLKYFHAVAKEGGFTSASVALRVQQPTISKMVLNLEEELGLKLIERHKRGIRLTRVGLDIFKISEGIFGAVEEIRALSKKQKVECEGRLAFGVPGSVSSQLIPVILKEFLSENPKVQATVVTGTSNLICNEIFDGRVEFGLFFAVPEKTDFQVTELINVPFNLVVSSDVKPERKNTFIIARRTDYSKTTPFPVLEMLNRHKIRITSFIASNNLESQKEMVRQGLGAALLPEFMVKSELKDGTFVALHSRKPFSYSLKLVTRKSKHLSRDASVFLEIFEKRMPQLIYSLKE